MNIVFNVDAKWFTFEKPDAISRSGQKGILTVASKKCENSAIAMHARVRDHKVNLDKFGLLAQIDKYFVPKTRESIKIAKHWTMLQVPKQLNNIWTYL